MKSKSKKINSVIENGMTLVKKLPNDRFIHGWYDIEADLFVVEAFTYGMPRDWHTELNTVEEFEAELRDTANLRCWGLHFL
jgi:hypothetical protein